jgi:Transposase and inactivated derivatives
LSEQSLAHTRWDCTYHIVWIPKYRKKVLYGECRTEMKAILRQLLEMKKIEIVEGAMCSDHVHLSIRIPPKYAVAEIMGFLKGRVPLCCLIGTRNGGAEWEETEVFGREAIM